MPLPPPVTNAFFPVSRRSRKTLGIERNVSYSAWRKPPACARRKSSVRIRTLAHREVLSIQRSRAVLQLLREQYAHIVRRCPLRAARTLEEPSIHDRGSGLPRRRDRGQYSCLQLDGSGAAEVASGAASRAIGVVQRARTAQWNY